LGGALVSVSPTATNVFDLAPGATILRKDLHARWGGRTQGGISPSRSTASIFIFWEPAVGEKHGYYDEFRGDGHFYYTGAGQYGDQRMRDANLALLNHQQGGRRVHLFAGAGGQVEYVGELELDAEEPYYETEAPETDDGPLRRVYVFNFRQLTGEPRGPRSRLEPVLGPEIEDVPIENRWTERFFVRPAATEYEAERREQELVRRLEDHLRSRGHDVSRLKIVPPGERRPIFCDLVDKTANVLIEGKGSVAREAIRMALGQLLDYRRFARQDVRLAVLLPERPREDLLRLLENAEVEAVWPSGGTFADTAGGVFDGGR
jgi:hypothetical protein